MTHLVWSHGPPPAALAGRLLLVVLETRRVAPSNYLDGQPVACVWEGPHGRPTHGGGVIPGAAVARYATVGLAARGELPAGTITSLDVA